MGHHYSLEMFQLYVDNKLESSGQMALENHLGGCDVCFQDYLTVVEQWSFPHELSDNFTNQTVQMIKAVQPNLSQKEILPSKKDNIRKTLTNYVLAAGLTVVLMFSGVFQFMTNISDKLSVKDEPLTEKLVTKTTSLLNVAYTDDGEEDRNHE